MDAFFARNRLSAYLDGELNAAEARDVEAALARDPALRRELDELREAVDLLHEAGIVEPPAGFAERLSARLENEPMPVGWRRWVRTIRPEALMLAAAALLVIAYVGNHKSLPDLEAPTEGVVAGKAFDKAAADAAPEVEAAPAAQGAGVDGEPPAAPSATGLAANGVLGDEAGRVEPKEIVLDKKASKLAKPVGTSGKAEVEPWQAEWEKAPEFSTTTTAKSVAPGASTGSNGEVRWAVAPPFRYQVTASDDMALKKLATIAKELGGELQDVRGRPLAGYQLDAGDAASVRVAVPAHNASVLAARLREIGAVVTIQETAGYIADPNADVPVAVTIQN